MIIQPKHIKHTLFLDIETVSVTASLDELSSTMQDLWCKKAKQFTPDRSIPSIEDAAIFYEQKAGIFAEFAKIACITVGYLAVDEDHNRTLRLKTFAGNEVELLTEFNQMLDRHYDDPDTNFLCGHNLKEFDIPFICRRSVIHGLHLPRLVNIAGKKPWQITYLLDTMELWKFGDYKNYTSLALLAGVLGIPTPKDDIDGSMVGHVFWVEDDIDRIVTYCEKDVVTVAQVAMKFAGLEFIDEDNIEVV